jgi:hypothetical protein
MVKVPKPGKNNNKPGKRFLKLGAPASVKAVVAAQRATPSARSHALSQKRALVGVEMRRLVRMWHMVFCKGR